MEFAHPVKILVVDYHTVVCRGIVEVLRSFLGFEVVGHAECREEALSLCEKHHPDVISIDVDLHGVSNGIDVIRELRSMHPQTQVVVLTNIFEVSIVNDTLRSGAISYLLKNISTEELAHAILSAYRGQSTLSPEVTQMLVRALAAPSPVGRTLTLREHQVLELISSGLTNNEIAEELNVSLSTVQFHVRNILGKLGVHNRIEAATFAVRQELTSHSNGIMPS